jgi:dipeptidase
MCDTLVALGNSTKDGSVIFAKNSDRQPNEPHIIVRIPRKKHKKGERLKCTYIEIDQAQTTYEVLLLKPSWIWGCEMGCNEFGLNIGNEAVFTREKYGKESLLGMDMVRLALERCKTSDEALDLLIELLEKYGQGGNCGYEKKFTYHNSFLIADKKSAWVLETAGRYWAAERVKDVRSISNCLTIGKNFDRCHPDLVIHAVEKGWCKKEEEFHFAKCYSNQLITKLSGARERYKATINVLEKEKGNITVKTVKRILRNHENKVEGKQFKSHSLKSVCMHGGYIYGDHTTGSYIAVLRDNIDTYWVTGSSTPCISVYKPFWLVDEENILFNEKEERQAVEYWKIREKLHRMIIENRILNLNDYLEKRDSLEKEFLELVNNLDLENINNQLLIKIMEYAWKKEENLILETINQNERNKGKIKGGTYYRYYWHKQSKKLFSK